MPRYFFNISDHEQDIDDSGTELPDDARARIEAVRYAGAVLAEEPGQLWDGTPFHVHVVNEAGTRLFTVTASVTDYDTATSQP